VRGARGRRLRHIDEPALPATGRKSSTATKGSIEAARGCADEFIAAWIGFAEWTADNVEGAGRGMLLRDTSDDHRFVSIGPWESFAAIELLIDSSRLRSSSLPSAANGEPSRLAAVEG
jgi:hypothetical protein